MRLHKSMNQAAFCHKRSRSEASGEQQTFSDEAAGQSKGRYSTISPMAGGLFARGRGQGRSPLCGINLFVSDSPVLISARF